MATAPCNRSLSGNGTVRPAPTFLAPLLPDRKKQIFALGASFREEVRVTGTGVGLHYVRRVITARGGTIVETGVPGEGACFEFVLPTHVPKPETITQ